MQILMSMLLKRKGRLFRIAAVVLVIACLTALLAQTAFAQKTFVITDGDRVTVHTTFTSDPARALEEAGVQLAADDFYTTAAVDGVSEITVQRAMVVNVDNCGQALEITSYGESIAQLLTRMGIPSTGNYRVSLPLDTVTCDGMEISVSYVVEGPETYTVEIPYTVTYCDDPTLPAGQEKTLITGEPGQMLCEANVVYVNSTETSRTVMKETVLQQPVHQVVAVGTGENVGAPSGTIFGDGVIILPSGEVLTYTHTDQYVATAYTKTDAGCDDDTATGSMVHVGVVAVDPKVIPYGTRMFIVTNDGKYIYGIGTAEDCGGAIQNKRLDLYFDTDPECWAFGIRDCTVYFLGDANWR